MSCATCSLCGEVPVALQSWQDHDWSLVQRWPAAAGGQWTWGNTAKRVSERLIWGQVHFCLHKKSRWLITTVLYDRQL